MTPASRDGVDSLREVLPSASEVDPKMGQAEQIRVQRSRASLASQYL